MCSTLTAHIPQQMKQFSLVIKRTVLLILIVSTLASNSQAASRVIISAEASMDYEQNKNSKNKDEVTRYHFVEGKFFRGHANDNSLTDISFFEIAENLAGHLANQNYVPSGNVKENEVMLLVNWGVTAVEESLEDLLGITSNEEFDQMFGSPVTSEDSSGDTVTTYEPVQTTNWSALGKRGNAKMLGFWNTMHDGSLMPSEHHEFQTLLNEERYFIVVIAFDNQKFVQNKEKDILWVTRFSMRAKGTSFGRAFPELTATAADYFGQNLKGLTRKRTDDNSQVLVGEIEVINEEEDSDSPE